MPPEARQKLKDKLQAIEDAVTRQDLAKAIEAMLVFEKNLGKRTEAELTAIKKAVDSAIERIQTIAQKESETSKQEIMDYCDNMMNEMRLTHESMMAECDQKMSEVKDGEDGMDGLDADEEEIIAKILPQLPKPKEPELTLKDKEKLEDEIEELRKKIANTRTAPFIGPSRGVFLYVNGQKKGIINSLNIEGDGVSTSIVNGLLTLTIAGGTGTMVDDETPTGTINGSNDTFILAHTPTVGSVKIYLNGARLRVGEDYTISGSTITFIIPPLTGSILLADYRY